ncbi:MAG: hypothetical protein ABSE73_03850 [Planctomycetota bacterium]
MKSAIALCILGLAHNACAADARPPRIGLNNKWYMYVQAAHSGYYIVQHWAMYGIEFDDYMSRILAL